MIRLTRGEFDMFAALLQHKGVPVSRDYLLDVISANSTEASDRTVDTLVSRIRSKLRERKNHALIIETVRGIGYRLLDVSNLRSGSSSQKSA
ncbi:MAG: helix-turn-helix domain-containing protein [Alphaproteobacteria bacterium]